MKVLTQSLKDEQTQLNQKYWKKVLLSRAQWNGGTNEYDWTTAIDIEEYLIKINQISWKLDSSALNSWKVGNVTIEVRNDEDQWDIDTTGGVWDNYFIRGSKIQVQAGNYLPDGSKELLYIFTGIIDRDIEYIPEQKIARIYVSGMERKLDLSDATNVSTQITAENMGTGNGALVDFTTANNGVGRFDEVRIAAVVQKKGEDYGISQLNDANNPGKITFVTPPAAGTIWGDYIYWYQDRTIEWIVEELVKEAGFTDYDISAVIFPNDVIVTWTEDQTTGEFDQGIAQAVDYANDELKLFSQYNFIEINDITIRSLPYTNTDTLSYGQKTTLISVRFQAADTSAFWVDILDASDNVKWSGYVFRFGAGSVSKSWEIDLTQWFNYGDTYKIRRRQVSGSTGTSNLLRVQWPAFNYGEDGKFESQARDCTASVKSFGKLTYGGNIPAGSSVIFKTATSTDDITYDAEVEIGPTGDILSAIKRYIKYFVYFTSDGSVNPTIDSISVEYTTTEAEIELVNLTGLTCKTAIEQLALMPDYEWGFDATGRFFFRSKETSETPIMSFQGDVNRIQLLNYNNGFDRIFNDITATFGIYAEKKNPIIEGESQPHSFDKYGIRPLSVSGGNLLGDEGVNIALGVAERYYDSYKDPVTRARVRIKFLPQLDLSDIINMPYTGLAGAVFDKNFKIIGISLNLELWYLDSDLQEIV